jgi:hypothetical protein
MKAGSRKKEILQQEAGNVSTEKRKQEAGKQEKC